MSSSSFASIDSYVVATIKHEFYDGILVYSDDELLHHCENIGKNFVKNDIIRGYYCQHKKNKDGSIRLILQTPCKIDNSLFTEASDFLKTKGVVLSMYDFNFVPQGSTPSHPVVPSPATCALRPDELA